MAVRLSMFSNFSQATIVTQRIRNLRYDVRIHTYIHTDTACVQHVNVGLAQARPNKSVLGLGRCVCCSEASTIGTEKRCCSYVRVRNETGSVARMVERKYSVSNPGTGY